MDIGRIETFQPQGMFPIETDITLPIDLATKPTDWAVEVEEITEAQTSQTFQPQGTLFQPQGRLTSEPIPTSWTEGDEGMTEVQTFQPQGTILQPQRRLTSESIPVIQPQGSTGTRMIQQELTFQPSGRICEDDRKKPEDKKTKDKKLRCPLSTTPSKDSTNKTIPPIPWQKGAPSPPRQS